MKKLFLLFVCLFSFSTAWAIDLGTPPLIYQYTNMTAIANVQAKTGIGFLHSVTYNKATATTVITLSDQTSNAAPRIATILIPANSIPTTLVYDVVFTTGLNIDLSVLASDITISWR